AGGSNHGAAVDSVRATVSVPSGPAANDSAHGPAHATTSATSAMGDRITGVIRPSFPLEPELLVGCRARHVGDEPDGRLGDPWPVAGQDRRLHERGVHDLLVNEPLDPVEDRLALRAIELGRLLSDEAFDVGIRSVREEAGSSDERVEPGRRVSLRRARALDDVLEPLLPVFLEEGRALLGPKRRADPYRAPVPGHGFGERGVGHIHRDHSGIEPIRVSRLGYELPPYFRVIRVEWSRPERTERPAFSRSGSCASTARSPRPPARRRA